MNNYNTIVRCLTEWTANSPHMTMDQSTINEGIGGIVLDTPPAAVAATALLPSVLVPYNVRQKFIHGVSVASPITAGAVTLKVGGSGVAGKAGASNAPPGYTAIANYTPITQRYQIQLALGLFSQGKYIPTKFMASQLAIEITLEQSQNCLFTDTGAIGASVTANTPTYGVGNVTLLPEILEFDASYDESFLRGLQQGGVPIKFSTWNNYRFTTSGASSNLQIQERSRSVKSIFCLQRRPTPAFNRDSGASFFNTHIDTTNGAYTLQDYQFRIGGR